MSKQPVPPGVAIGAIALVVLLVAGWFFMSSRDNTTKVDLKAVDTKDEDPIRPGQPGYQERTTDTPQ